MRLPADAAMAGRDAEESAATGALSYGPPRLYRSRLSHVMANIHSQKKRILRSERERLENRRYTSAIKTYFRRLEAAVAGKDTEAADAEHKLLVRTIDKAVKVGALHRNNGARKKSRAARVRKSASA
jgi:small subunit ribosomal protein S20